MPLSRIPLPSIAFVLTSDRSSLPSHPSVIKLAFDPLQTIYPTPPGPGRVLGPIGIQIDSIAVQTEGHNNVPAVDEHFFCVTNANDSSKVAGHSDHGQLGSGSDAQTMFAQTRPTTSCGSRSRVLAGDVMLKGNFVALASTIRSLFLQFKPKGSPKNKGVQVTKTAVDE
jgi:hypothetical protein